MYDILDRKGKVLSLGETMYYTLESSDVLILIQMLGYEVSWRLNDDEEEEDLPIEVLPLSIGVSAAYT